VDIIRAQAPDLVFLDVQMPGLDGFGVVDAVGAAAMPLVVFATAYDEYAIRAFDAQAIDYLLKPFDEERFRRTLRRVREGIAWQKPGASLARLMQALSLDRRYLQRLAVQVSGRVLFVATDEIDWLEASGNYITLHVGAASHLVRDTLSALEAKLDPAQFVRVHRSTMVNVQRIRELTPWVRGEQAVILSDGTQLAIGRAYRARLKAMFSNSLDG
jgi:two-component system LytT family response regulator